VDFAYDNAAFEFIYHKCNKLYYISKLVKHGEEW